MVTNVLEYLEEITEQYPEKIAYADLLEEISFDALMGRAKAIGSCIAEQRVAAKEGLHGYPVVVYMEKHAYNVAAFFGAVYAGAFYVPIDAKMPMERIQLIFDVLEPRVILCDDKTMDKAGDLPGDYDILNVRGIETHPVNEDLLQQIRLSGKNTDPLYVLFTSGSTGIPKGVTLSHGAVIDFTEWIVQKYALTAETTLCNQAPFYFDASVPDLYIPLKTGATVYIPPKTYYTFPKKVLQYIVDKKVNTLVWVPSALCTVVNARAFEVTVPDTISLVIFCGEVMPCKHLNVWRKYIPDALYVNMYGPTEATYACTYYDIKCNFKDGDKLPLGKACENSEIILLNDENKITEDLEIGELCILGQCLANGYYGAREKTREVFIQNPVNTKWDEMLYRTGDLAYRDADGILWFAGRKDFQIKRQGHRIELGEIENAMVAAEGIENACCLYNEESGNIIAIYTGNVSQEQLHGHLQTRLQHYMLPEKYVPLKAMPMNLNGKIDRPALKETYGEL